MKLVTATSDFRVTGNLVPAESRRVVSEACVSQWLQAAGRLRISSLRSWERPYYGQSLDGKSLWTWRGSGFGDLMVMSAILNELARCYPTARLALSTPDPDSVRKLLGCCEPDCDCRFDVIGDVLAFEDWLDYDYHRPVEEIVEWDQEPDQTDIYTTHYRYFGRILAAKSPTAYTPANVVTGRARGMAADWMAREGIAGPVIVYQSSASSDIRSQSEARMAECVAAIMAAFYLPVVVVGGKRDEMRSTPPGAHRLIAQDPRVTFGLLASAAAVVTPDSMLNHVCAGMSRQSPPVVSMWSAFSPADRVGQYPNQHPIVAPAGDCAPCRAHDGPDMRGCPLHGGFCRQMDKITAAQIVARLKEIIV